MSIYENDGRRVSFGEKAEIEKILAALEEGENPPERENYRAAVRNYQNYLVPFLTSEAGTRQVFKMRNLYQLESVPVFLDREVYLLFQNDYLEKHGYLAAIESERAILTLEKMTGSELYELLPQSSLGSVFVISPDHAELFFNFNLAEVFTDCFHEAEADTNFALSDLSIDAEIETQENPRSIEAVEQSARRKIEKYRKFRKLFENPEWIVLISQPTKNKLLKGEFSRDDFDLDRYGDRRIFVFSGAAALDDYKNATGQAPEKLYNIKIDRRRLFGSDLSRYEVMIIDPHAASAAQIGEQDFSKLNELLTAFEIESKLTEIDIARQSPGRYLETAEHYIGIKEFQGFILPIDGRLQKALSESSGRAFDLARDVLQLNGLFPVFTSEDNFEAFRLKRLEKFAPEETNFIEPYFIDGTKLFQALTRMKTQGIVFNAGGPAHSITFEPNFALKFYCA